jgi:hypothetical protein
VTVAAVEWCKTDGQYALDPPVRQLLAGQRRHRAVREQTPLAQCGPELRVLTHDIERRRQLFRARQRLACRLDHAGRGSAVERDVDQKRLLLLVVVQGGAHGLGRHGLGAGLERHESDEPRAVAHGPLRRLGNPIGIGAPRLHLHFERSGHGGESSSSSAGRVNLECSESAELRTAELPAQRGDLSDGEADVGGARGLDVVL